MKITPAQREKVAQFKKLYARRDYNVASLAMRTQIRPGVHLIVNDEYWGFLADTSYKAVREDILNALDPLFSFYCEIEPLGGTMDCKVKALFPPLYDCLPI